MEMEMRGSKAASLVTPGGSSSKCCKYTPVTLGPRMRDWAAVRFSGIAKIAGMCLGGKGKRQRTLLLRRIVAIPPAWQIGHALPPHPSPLPWGEGAPWRTRLAIARAPVHRMMGNGLPPYEPLLQVASDWHFQTCLPPHPDPLPWGEGAPWRTRPRLQWLRFVQGWEMALPLPKGEGWGEGETAMRTRIGLRGIRCV